MDRREIDLYVNIPLSEAQTGAADKSAVSVEMFRGEEVLLKITCLNNADTQAAYALPASSTFDIGVSDNFEPGTTENTKTALASAANAEFNQGDWGSESITGGLISVRLNLNTTNLAYNLNTAESKTLYLTCYYAPPSLDARVLFQIPFTCFALGYEAATAAAPTPAASYLTTAAATALYMPIGGSFTSGIALTPMTAPSTPASGYILYVDTADGFLKVKNSSGTTTELA